MRILALITARGGSKRIPKKNIRTLGGAPLIVWSINVASGVSEICDILVSTDDPAIAEVASKAGALVPWLRPEELASDTAGSVDACLHALNWYEAEHGEVDGVLLLQPTSPFRRQQTVLKGIELFMEHQFKPIVAVSPANSHPMWCFKVDGNRMRPFLDVGGGLPRSQDLPPAYVVNGALYLVTPKHIRDQRSFYSEEMIPLIMDDPFESIDIDTEWDWKVAELSLNSKR